MQHIQGSPSPPQGRGGLRRFGLVPSIRDHRANDLARVTYPNRPLSLTLTLSPRDRHREAPLSLPPLRPSAPARA